MKTVNYSDGRRLYPLKENRYKLVSSLITHIRKIMYASHKIGPLNNNSFNPDHQVFEDPVQLAVEDYLDGKIEQTETKSN